MKEEDFILIENYLKGTLSKDEEDSFLERLDSDAQFEAEFKLEQQAFNTLSEDQWSFIDNSSSEVQEYKEALQDNDIQELKLTIDRLYSNQKQAHKGINKNLYYYIVAASVVVFLGFQFFFSQNVSNQELYNSYIGYDSLPSFVTRGSTNETEHQLVQAQHLFEKGEYEASLAIFKPFLESETNNTLLYIYIGIAQTELGLYQEAKATFDQLKNNESTYDSISYWYTALLYLKQERIDEVKEVLNTIISNSYYNHEKAQDLLNEIE